MSKKKILVVDDEVAIRNMFEQAFSRDGSKVRSAEDAEEALELLRVKKFRSCFWI